MRNSIECVFDHLEPRTHFAAGDPSNDFGVDGYRRFSKEYGRITWPGEIYPLRNNGLLALVGGENRVGGRPVAVNSIARITPQGWLDPTFGENGRIDSPMNVYAVTERSDGKVYLLGRDNRSVHRVIRLRRDGTIDRSFGIRGGVALAADVGYSDFAGRAHIDADGVVTAFTRRYTNGGESLGALIQRFRPDGSLDPAFGTGGTITLKSKRFEIIPNGLIVLPDGSFFLNAWRSANGRGRSVVQRYTPAGVLDAGFGDGGTRYPAEGTYAIGVALLRKSLRLTTWLDNRYQTFSAERIDYTGRSLGALSFSGGEAFGVAAGTNAVELPDGTFLSEGRHYFADGTFDEAFGYVRAGTVLSYAGDRLYGTYDRGITSVDLVGNRSRQAIGLDNAGRLHVNGTSGDDVISLNVNRSSSASPNAPYLWTDVTLGGVGRSFLAAHIEDAVVLAGAGNDRVSSNVEFQDIRATLRGEAGNDDLHAGGYNTGGIGGVVEGGDGNDTLGGGDAFLLEGGAGDDDLRGGGGYQEPFYGPTTLRGGDGNDRFETSGAAWIEAGNGNDTVYATAGGLNPGYRPTVHGDAGNDLLVGYPLYLNYTDTIGQVFYGDAGNDTIDAGDGPDYLNGGPGRDVLRGGKGDDTLVTDADDVIVNR